jgi:hypothetical protein
MSNSAKNILQRKVKCQTSKSSLNIFSVNHSFIDESVYFNYSEATLTRYLNYSNKSTNQMQQFNILLHFIGFFFTNFTHHS